jgi:hypothetical protein
MRINQPLRLAIFFALPFGNARKPVEADDDTPDAD